MTLFLFGKHFCFVFNYSLHIHSHGFTMKKHKCLLFLFERFFQWCLRHFNRKKFNSSTIFLLDESDNLFRFYPIVSNKFGVGELWPTNYTLMLKSVDNCDKFHYNWNMVHNIRWNGKRTLLLIFTDGECHQIKFQSRDMILSLVEYCLLNDRIYLVQAKSNIYTFRVKTGIRPEHNEPNYQQTLRHFLEI